MAKSACPQVLYVLQGWVYYDADFWTMNVALVLAFNMCPLILRRSPVSLFLRANVKVLKGVLRGHSEVGLYPGSVRSHPWTQPKPPSPQDPQVRFTGTYDYIQFSSILPLRFDRSFCFLM